MEKLKTLVDIDIFVCKLLFANVKLPKNVSIKIELSKKEFNNIVHLHSELRNCGEIGYNIMGMKVFLTTKKK